MWDSCNILKLTSACKRINKERRCEFVPNKSKADSLERHSRKDRTKSSCHSLTPKECQPTEHADEPFANGSSDEHLSNATPTSPANLSMVISQSYKPLHAKSTQFNRKTIAVTKGTHVKALYKISNWVFIENPKTGETGLIPIYCLSLPETLATSFDSPSQNNISLLNVSVYEKPRYSRLSIMNNRSYDVSTPPPGRFISTIGPCQLNNESQVSTCPRSLKTSTFTRQLAKDESTLSRQISNVSLHEYDAYGTLNTTRCRNLSFSIVDREPVILRRNQRLRVIESYQKQFVGDISVLESEVVVPVNTIESIGNWKLIRRGDGKQGYIPEHIVVLDKNFT
ncbi:unnamed protein product [Adineta ricciae]|uniref:SH3 domain-containing protein n=1 Tax=Adineta ricciae TaxID=249248 RepID=A0A815RTI7_ADIRI|nr:unnamed protein product [Adineta ricciae]CAF1482257.1 unnamed protein product [Adineta ricciae]